MIGLTRSPISKTHRDLMELFGGMGGHGLDTLSPVQIDAMVELYPLWMRPDPAEENAGNAEATAEDDGRVGLLQWLLMRKAPPPTLPEGRPWPSSLEGFEALNQELPDLPRTQEWFTAWVMLGGDPMVTAPDAPDLDLANECVEQKHWDLLALLMARTELPLRDVLDQPHDEERYAERGRRSKDRRSATLRTLQEGLANLSDQPAPTWTVAMQLMHRLTVRDWKALLAHTPGFRPTLWELAVVDPATLDAFPEWRPTTAEDRETLREWWARRFEADRDNVGKLSNLPLHRFLSGPLSRALQWLDGDSEATRQATAAGLVNVETLHGKNACRSDLWIDDTLGDPVAFWSRPCGLAGAESMPLLGVMLIQHGLRVGDFDEGNQRDLWRQWLIPPSEPQSLNPTTHTRGTLAPLGPALAPLLGRDIAPGVPFRGLVLLSAFSGMLEGCVPEDPFNLATMAEEASLFGLDDPQAFALEAADDAWKATQWLLEWLPTRGYGNEQTNDDHVLRAWRGLLGYFPDLAQSHPAVLYDLLVLANRRYGLLHFKRKISSERHGNKNHPGHALWAPLKSWAARPLSEVPGSHRDVVAMFLLCSGAERAVDRVCADMTLLSARLWRDAHAWVKEEDARLDDDDKLRKEELALLGRATKQALLDQALSTDCLASRRSARL